MTKMIYDEDACKWFDLDEEFPHSHETDEEYGYAFIVFLIVAIISYFLGK
jgi:hypothetical protein